MTVEATCRTLRRGGKHSIGIASSLFEIFLSSTRISTRLPQPKNSIANSEINPSAKGKGKSKSKGKEGSGGDSRKTAFQSIY